MSHRYLCIYDNGEILGVGETLNEAFENVRNGSGIIYPGDCEFFRIGLSPINVKVKAEYHITE